MAMAGWSEQNIELGDVRAAFLARRQRPPGAGAASRDRHPGPPAVLRRAGRQLRRAGAAPSRLQRPERPEWMRHPRDIAALYQWLLAELGIERASAGRPRLRRLDRGRDGQHGAGRSLPPGAGRRHGHQAAAGRHPRPGDRVSYIDYARAGFHDQKAFDRVYGAEPSVDQLEMWDICREMSFRIAWKPYMYSQTLPHLLGGVRAPALVVWGDDDKVVPQSAGKRYAKRCPTPSWKSSRRAAIASTWSSPRRSPSSSRSYNSSGSERRTRHAPDVFHRAADVGLSPRRPAWTSAPPR